MTIELTDKSYILGIWFSEIPTTNFMMTVYKDTFDSPLIARGRFRYFKDGKIFGSEDTKNWMTLTPKASEITEDKMLIIMDDVLAEITKSFGHAFNDKIIVRGDLNKLYELSKDHPWMQMQKENFK